MITSHAPTPENIEVAAGSIPSWLYTSGAANSFIVGGWFRRSTAQGASTSFRCLAFMQNLWAFRISSTAVGFKIMSNTADVATPQPSTGGDINDQWVFVLAGWDKGANTAWCCVKSTFGRVYASAAAAWATHTPGKWSIGENKATADGGSSGVNYNGWAGEIACITVKNIQLSTQATIEAIVDACYAARNVQGLLDYRGNGLSGINDAKWLALNCTLPQVVDTGIIAGAVSGARMGSAIVGGANTNYCWTLNGNGDAYDKVFNVARDCTVVGTLTFDADNEFVADWFQPALPGITTDGAGSVNSSFGARLYAGTPRGRERAWVISNSRGQRTIEYAADGDSNSLWHNFGQNHAQGYVAATLAQCCGFCSGYVNQGAIERRFAFDCDAAPYVSGTASYVHNTNFKDFSRCCNGSGIADTGQSPGPGKVTRLTATTILTVRGRDCPGSLLTKDKPWTLTLRYLRYPSGASDPTFSWTGVTHTGQAGAGTATGQSASNISYGTSQASRAMAGSDTYTSGTRTLVLGADLSAVQAGWLVFVHSGTGVGSIAEVQSVSYSAPNTTMVLRHVFGTGPSVAGASVLHFGPWSFGTTSVVLAARPGGAEFAGMNVNNDGDGDLILVSADVETDDAAGWVWGEGGWSGQGYGPQLDEAWTDAFADLAANLQVDAVLMHNATQSSVTADRKAMADSIQAGVPNADILYVADQMHDVGDDGAWATESLIQADYAAVVATEDPTLGDTLTQFARGYKGNASHPSIEGMYLLALASIARMSGYTDPGSGTSTGRRRTNLLQSTRTNRQLM